VDERQRSVAARFTVTTPSGPAEVVIDSGEPVHSLLVLGHGAGGGVDAPDLVAVTRQAVEAGVAVGRVTQPYRVAGRRAPAPAHVLDAAWTVAVRACQQRVREDMGHGDVRTIVGGRSSGARVACRTAASLGASGVLALAFPLHPPGRPSVSRAGELDPALPTLVVNGDRDAFGVPQADGLIEVVQLPGERHDLRRDPAGVARTAIAWLVRHGWAGTGGPAP
jgi:uncharacterized protein